MCVYRVATSVLHYPHNVILSDAIHRRWTTFICMPPPGDRSGSDGLQWPGHDGAFPTSSYVPHWSCVGSSRVAGRSPLCGLLSYMMAGRRLSIQLLSWSTVFTVPCASPTFWARAFAACDAPSHASWSRMSCPRRCPPARAPLRQRAGSRRAVRSTTATLRSKRRP